MTPERPACRSWTLPPDGTSHEEWNPHLCAFCGQQTPNPVLDHDHTTGLERGYICRRCNRMESVAWGEEHPLGPAWAAWRAGCNPAALLGQAIPYNGFGWRDGVHLVEQHYGGEPTVAELQQSMDALARMFSDPHAGDGADQLVVEDRGVDLRRG